MLATSRTALSLTFYAVVCCFGRTATAAPPAQESSAPTVVLGTKEERLAKATENYANNRPVEAALGFEGLWRDFPGEVDFLFNAAASRFAARHFAHAVAYTRDYLAVAAVSPEDRKEAQAQLDAALKETTTVTVTMVVEEPPANDVTLSAEHVARESGDVRPPLLFKPTSGTATQIQLDPGVWMLRARAADHGADEQRIEVIAGRPLATTLRLRPQPKAVVDPPKPPPEIPSATVRGMKLGFAAGGGVLVVGGVATLVAGLVGVGRQADCVHDGSSACVSSFARGMTIRDAGAMTLGGGFGSIAGGLPWLSRDPVLRGKIWIGEMVVGGAALIGGLVWRPFAAGEFNDANRADLKDWDAHYTAHRQSAGHAVAAMLVGLGAGAFVSATAGLVVQRRHLKRLRVNPVAGTGLAGVVLSGRF